MLISVILPNYNHGHFLPTNLDGLLQQTYKNWEVILVDDGSTDNSRDIIASYAARDNRIKPIFLEKNQGVIKAVDIGWNNIKGDLYYGSGADDYVSNPNFFDKTINALTEHPQAAGVAFQCQVVDAETDQYLWTMGTNYLGYIDEYNTIRAFFERQLFIPGTSVIWKTHLLTRIGAYIEKFGGQADYFFNHALPANGGVCFVNEVGAVYRKSPTTFSAKESKEDYFLHHALTEKELVEKYSRFYIEKNIRKTWRDSVIDEKLHSLQIYPNNDNYQHEKQKALSMFNEFAGFLD